MTDLSHDRVVQLCEDLKLPGILDAYAALAAAASEEDQSFTDFLENTLTAERDFRRARSAAAANPAMPARLSLGGMLKP